MANPTEWISQGGTKLVLYAHGGLNSENDSIDRIRVMAPYFKANDLYPIFFTWRTGFQESLLNIMGDAVQGVEPQGAWKDIWECMKDAAKEAKDREVEVACQNLLVKTVQEGQKFWGDGKPPLEHSEIHVSDGVREIPLAHGSFDNDIVVMTRTLERILGKNLSYPIENLKGY